MTWTALLKELQCETELHLKFFSHSCTSCHCSDLLQILRFSSDQSLELWHSLGSIRPKPKGNTVALWYGVNSSLVEALSHNKICLPVCVLLICGASVSGMQNAIKSQFLWNVWGYVYCIRHVLFNPSGWLAFSCWVCMEGTWWGSSRSLHCPPFLGIHLNNACTICLQQKIYVLHGIITW